MGYETRAAANVIAEEIETSQQEYDGLKKRIPNFAQVLQRWIDEVRALPGRDQTEVDEKIAMEAAMVLALRTVLGL